MSIKHWNFLGWCSCGQLLTQYVTAGQVNTKISSRMTGSMTIEIVKLHDYKELTTDVVRILNHEWPRSESARIYYLNNSKDDLPCSLLLVHKYDNGNMEVIGHSRLSKVHGKPKSVFIENVIIKKSRRGCGCGRMLMELTELHASKIGYEDIHLSTHDKSKFYEYLGYVYSFPVSPVRENAKLLTPEQVPALQIHFGEQNKQVLEDSSNKQIEENSRPKQPKRIEVSGHEAQRMQLQKEMSLKNSKIYKAESQCQSPQSQPLPLLSTPTPPSPPPPPPPPPPFLPLGKTCINYELKKQFWMVKHIQ